jgi:hypothetical protein
MFDCLVNRHWLIQTLDRVHKHELLRREQVDLGVRNPGDLSRRVAFQQGADERRRLEIRGNRERRQALAVEAVDVGPPAGEDGDNLWAVPPDCGEQGMLEVAILRIRVEAGVKQ